MRHKQFNEGSTRDLGDGVTPPPSPGNSMPDLWGTWGNKLHLLIEYSFRRAEHDSRAIQWSHVWVGTQHGTPPDYCNVLHGVWQVVPGWAPCPRNLTIYRNPILTMYQAGSTWSQLVKTSVLDMNSRPPPKIFQTNESNGSCGSCGYRCQQILWTFHRHGAWRPWRPCQAWQANGNPRAVA